MAKWAMRSEVFRGVVEADEIAVRDRLVMFFSKSPEPTREPLRLERAICAPTFDLERLGGGTFWELEQGEYLFARNGPESPHEEKNNGTGYEGAVRHQGMP